MMNDDEYNEREIVGRRIRADHVTTMTLIAQAHLKITPRDGKCGPATRAALETAVVDTEGNVWPRVPGMTPPAPPAQTIGEAVVAFAITLIGQGEEGANNAGSFITRIGGRQGYEWCALSAGYAWRETLTRAGKTPGPEWYRRKGVPEPGALNLARALEAASKAAGGLGRFMDPAAARPGDIATLDHGDGHGHTMLVEFVDDGLTHTLEGNVGKYPAKYRRLVRDLAREPRFWGYVRPRV